MKKLRYYFLTFLASFGAIFLVPTTAMAKVTGSKLDMFAENNIYFYDPDDDCIKSVDLSGVEASGTFNENAIYVMTVLLSKGYSAESVAAIIGNLKGEGSAFNPGEVENGYGDDQNNNTFRITESWECYNKCGFGIAQWTSGGRQLNLQAHADSLGLPVTSIEAQVSFLVKELSEKKCSVDELNSSLFEEATFKVFRFYETPRASFETEPYKGKTYNKIDPQTFEDLDETNTPAALAAFNVRFSYAKGALQTIKDQNLAEVAGSMEIAGSKTKREICNSTGDYGPASEKIIDGVRYVFPLAGATKSNYLNPGGSAGESVLSRLVCGAGNQCHHDYPAVDLGLRKKMVDGSEYKSGDFGINNLSDMYFYSTGVKVLAHVDGKITNYKTYSNKVPSDWVKRCASVTYEGVDGKTYWLGHMSYDSKYKPGDTFKAGDVIGEVGPPPCAQNTQAHLHLQTVPETRYVIDLMDQLYEGLPN